MRSLLFAALLAALLAVAAAVERRDTGISVSGLSSGAFAAVQFHVAFSSVVDGAGVFAGGPYYASQGSVLTAVALMKDPTLILPSALVAETVAAAATLSIDSPRLLNASRALLFSGASDSEVVPGVMRHLDTYYSAFGVRATRRFTVPAEHAFPAARYGNACAFLGPPYINDCGIDGAAEALVALYPALRPAIAAARANTTTTSTSTTTGSLIRVRQRDFAPAVFPWTLDLMGLAETAYAYVPQGCESVLEHAAVRGSLVGEEEAARAEQGPPSKAAAPAPGVEGVSTARLREVFGASAGAGAGAGAGTCRVHVVLHGCRQSATEMGTVFVEHTGYMPVADATRTVMVFPQARANTLNPKGCWDWWGYSGVGFATKLAPQMGVLANMAAAFKADTLFG